MPRDDFIHMHKKITKKGFECIQTDDPEEMFDGYLLRGLAIRYVKKGSHIPDLEVKMAKDALDDYSLEKRKRLPFTGLDVYFSSIESSVAFKEELLTSDKDMEDAKHLRIIYKETLDEEEIENIKGMIRRLRLK